MQEGKLPLKSLYPRSRYARLVGDQMEEGIIPLNSLSDRSNVWIQVRFPKQGGRVPLGPAVMASDVRKRRWHKIPTSPLLQWSPHEYQQHGWCGCRRLCWSTSNGLLHFSKHWKHYWGHWIIFWGEGVLGIHGNDNGLNWQENDGKRSRRQQRLNTAQNIPTLHKFILSLLNFFCAILSPFADW